MLILEHALRLMGNDITRAQTSSTRSTPRCMVGTRNSAQWNYSPQVHNGPLENAPMAVQGAGSANWRLVTVHDAING